MEPRDEELVQACRRGDEGAWEILIRRYERLVHTVPRRAGLDAELCADVFQQVFATLVEQLDQIERPERIGAWLVTTARRATWRLSRRAAAAGVSLEGEGEAGLELPSNELLPEEQALLLEEQHAVRLAVESLDERCRNLLFLLFYTPTPPSYAEVAARLGVREGTIGPGRIRCLDRLRRQLGRLE